MVNKNPLQFDEHLHVRISQDQRDGLAALRTEEGDTESEQIRRLIDAAIKRGRR